MNILMVLQDIKIILSDDLIEIFQNNLLIQSFKIFNQLILCIQKVSLQPLLMEQLIKCSILIKIQVLIL